MWADNEADLDLLGFDFLVDALVVALTEPRLLPLTVGVLGDWGSGKSSLMQLAAKELAAVERDSDSDAGPDAPASPYLTVQFSPWQYEDNQDVKVALMTAVLDALERRLPDEGVEIGRLREFLKGLKKWLRRTGRVGTAAMPTVLPVVLQGYGSDIDPEVATVLTGLAGAGAKELGSLLAEPAAVSVPEDQLVPITDIKQFHKAFADLVGKLPEGDAVVVFIDDLDRCLPETVVDTFEAIRLFLNAPKTAYVLALNQNVVESAIDSRYPDITKADGAGLGRDYLEKMLQLKVVIPPLSAPEAETYVNLLFAELRLPTTDFDRVLERADANRAASGLSVAFNLGIAGELLGDELPESLTEDLAWAADITPILGSSLRGNPRQLKRFLNNLLLKHRSAARRKIVLKVPVLAKLMVLEDQFNTDFQKLFDWEMAAGGKCPELVEAEDCARAVAGPVADPSEDKAVAGPHSDSDAPAPKKRAATSKPEKAPVASEATTWAEKPHIGAWLKVEPSLKDVDLRPYFTYSRDKLSFGISGSRLAPHLQQLLANVQSDLESVRRSHYPAVKELDGGERAQLAEALLERVQRQPASIALTAAIELAEQNDDLVDAVAAGLTRLPVASVPTPAGTAAVRRLPVGHPAVVALLDHWQKGANRALQTVVAGARQANAKKGGAGGNLS